ncbi:hypothetical protein C1M55_21410 [Rhodococcus qingshengii]|uniref:hypothetical protein n=1 Tax=Rhodococcus TaxID=1827 RepID=UPI000976EF58|nr:MULTISPECIES: hypothetical protein [Rhodococcus]AUS33396.1 hypothetical protein C1M55_21410 [Rhodococcus qingshengii]MCC4305805.1 hypothetical protein [Rhodococcus sp. 3-2]OMQ38062.1 hypothetical protein BK799_01310 [Rhodococcus sp. D-1]
MTANGIDLATHLAQIHRQALGDQVYVRWEDLNEEAIASSVTAIIAVLAELHHQNLLVPDGGRPLTAEQWAHYQRMAADPRLAELSRDALGVVKWPANPPLANETEWPGLNAVPASVFAVKDRNGFQWRRRSNGTFCGRADCGNGHPDLGPFVADKER